MRDERAPIGGEGNGGVILSEVHLGRDAPVGAALLLQLLHEENRPLSDIVADLPRYVIVKDKLNRPQASLDTVYEALRSAFPAAAADSQDGLAAFMAGPVGACATVWHGTDRASDCRGTDRSRGSRVGSAVARAARRVGRVTLIEGTSSYVRNRRIRRGPKCHPDCSSKG